MCTQGTLFSTMYLTIFKLGTTQENNMCSRDRPRFFDQVGHQTTNASIGNMHFFTK